MGSVGFSSGHTDRGRESRANPERAMHCNDTNPRATRKMSKSQKEERNTKATAGTSTTESQINYAGRYNYNTHQNKRTTARIAYAASRPRVHLTDKSKRGGSDITAGSSDSDSGAALLDSSCRVHAGMSTGQGASESVESESLLSEEAGRTGWRLRIC